MRIRALLLSEIDVSASRVYRKQFALSNAGLALVALSLIAEVNEITSQIGAASQISVQISVCLFSIALLFL